MPEPGMDEEKSDFMKRCIPMVLEDGTAADNDQAVAICMSKWEHRNDAPAKFWERVPVIIYNASVKAVGAWKLDVTAVPFNSRDSDGQWFDSRTNIMEEAFTTPLALYQHGVKQGGKSLDDRPVVIGKTVPGSLTKKANGWHLMVILDQALKLAQNVMDAAMKGQVAVSSDSVSHLARLDVGGKLIGYEKNRPGRIAVWPLAGVSLWEKGNGNLEPANHMAIALPAMKAIYRKAGLPFPVIPGADAYGVSEAAQAARRAEIARVKSEARKILKSLE